MPLGPAESFAVDLAALDERACAECDTAAASGVAPDDAGFFYGRLPLGAVDALHAGPAGDGPGKVRAELGHLHLSGLFGGLYLRDNLDSIGARGGTDPRERLVSEMVGGLTRAALDSFVGTVTGTALGGSDAAVRAGATALAPLVALVYGYNRGYLEVALDRPPPGVEPGAPLSCDAFFACRTPQQRLEALDALAPTAERLHDPPAGTWAALSAGLHEVGAEAVEGGRAVWEGLLGGADFDPSAYAAVIELSHGFLEVTEVALLGLAEGAVGDVELGRSGLLATAALLTWSGSYFLGLATEAPTDDLPALTCTGTAPIG